MSSTDPIFNQPTTRDRATEADAIRQGYGSFFDFFAVWNVIADYSRKERLLHEPVRLNQLPAEIFWFGAKFATLGTVAAIGIVGLRLLVFGLLWYLFNLDRDVVNIVYLSFLVLLSMQYFRTLANYLRYPDGITDQLISININCVIGSVITVEVAKMIGLCAAYLCYTQIVSIFPHSPHSDVLLKWFYGYFLAQPWKLVLESCFFIQIIVCGVGMVCRRRVTLTENAEFDLGDE